MYTYDRAYRGFDKDRLEAGDIVIATNIAGRGTDLDISGDLKASGGLHVILSYLPSNVRVELQAFGRCARAGCRGSGTYIVMDRRKALDASVSIASLKTARNTSEEKRLATVENEQVPKIDVENTLMVKFCSLMDSVKQLLAAKEWDANCSTIQMDSLKNTWAIWLNFMEEKLNDLNQNNKAAINAEYALFEERVRTKCAHGRFQLPGGARGVESPGQGTCGCRRVLCGSGGV